MPSVVVTHTHVLANLVRTNLHAIAPLATELRFVITEAVLHGLQDRPQQTSVERAIADGTLRLERLDAPESLVTYRELKDEMGSEEAECLALASVDAERMLAADLRRHFRRVAVRRIGASRVLTTPGIILRMVRSGAVSIEEADRAKSILASSGFHMDFESFSDVIAHDPSRAPHVTSRARGPTA